MARIADQTCDAGWHGQGFMGGKVLIVDDVATNRIVMKVKLTAAGYLPSVAVDG